MPLLNNFKVFV